ncbi:MAG: 4Fe-4S dicluster domain-containing protein [Dethiobacter sp.]|jgi:Fe-S-cluster-containing hydrogenase component 2|nr:4Fe-4S dicluster domain-containing protein [Dethiobacter sp.]
MDIYESLREIMDAHPSTAPKARSIDEILKILFTPQRAGECTGCSICADERCPVKAIGMENNTAVINTAECIGCGLCVTGCPAGAVFFTERKQVPSTPATVMEMGLKVLQEKGRLESFQKIMQS